ncbi:MAG: GAF domain-containing sensor histidine kinase [Candidatus Elarobacter sp.]
MHERDVALFDAIATALTATDVERALEAALHEIVHALDLAAGWIWMVDPDTGRFYLAAAYDLPPYLREPVQMTGDPCWCMEAFIDGDFDSKNVDVIACSRLRRGSGEAGPDRTGGLLSHATVALRFGDRWLGIMNVCPRAPRKLSQTDLRLLAVTGAQLGLAAERGRLAEQQVSAARSAERARLAREIHDTLAQDLTAISLQLESALRDLPPESIALGARIGKALAVARASMAGARASVLSLRSDPLEGRPLANVLAALARRLTSETGVRVTFRERGATSLPYETESELFRIASEALANARLHAAASRIEVELDGDAPSVALRIRDDGAGFDPAAVTDDERYGLRGMAERARLIGAELQVTSARGAGTSIAAVVPRSGA